jgi:hypothetical protein
LFALALCVGVFSIGWSPSAEARSVQAMWRHNATMPTESATAADAKKQAFTEAVFQEALSLLPGPLPESRQVLLRDYLAPKAGEFVIGYSETGIEELPDGGLVSLDIQVNRRLLKRALQHLGVYYTLTEPRLYHLELRGADVESWEALGKLQLLIGTRVEYGAPTRLILERFENLWQGRLETEGASFSIEDEQLEKVWFGLWERLFSTMGIGSSATAASELRVNGWYATDGVDAFHRLLRSWDKEVESAELGGLTMRPTGIEAVWNVRTLNPQALRDRLDGYLSGRNLDYVFREGAPEQEVEGQEEETLR